MKRKDKIQNMEEMGHRERFQINIAELTELIQELITDCSERGLTDINPELIGLAKEIITSLDNDIIISSFIKKSHTYWDAIHQKNEEFFINDCKQVFNTLPSDQVDSFSVLFSSRDDEGNPIITGEDKDIIWDYFHSLVKIEWH